MSFGASFFLPPFSCLLLAVCQLGAIKMAPVKPFGAGQHSSRVQLKHQLLF